MVIVQRGAGLHARPASDFVKLASRFPGAVTIGLKGREVNAKSILGVLSLGANKGSEIELRVEGDGADAELNVLRSFLAGDGS